MTYVALLLSPDDNVLMEVAVPRVEQVIRMAAPNKAVKNWFNARDSLDITTELTFKIIEFELQHRETEEYRLVRPDILIYRQRGWEHNQSTVAV